MDTKVTFLYYTMLRGYSAFKNFRWSINRATWRL